MRMFGKIVLWFLLGFVATYVAAVAIGIGYMEVADVSQREGAAAMGLIFIIGPACALVGGVVSATIAAVKSSNPQTKDPT